MNNDTHHAAPAAPDSKQLALRSNDLLGLLPESDLDKYQRIVFDVRDALRIHTHVDRLAYETSLMWCRLQDALASVASHQAAINAAVAAERERCKLVVHWAQYRNGYHTHEGMTMGHYDIKMVSDIESGFDPRA